jgi:hypothetical protein
MGLWSQGLSDIFSISAREVLVKNIMTASSTKRIFLAGIFIPTNNPPSKIKIARNTIIF